MVGRWRCLTRRLVAELLGLDPPRFVHGLLDHQSPLLLALLTALSESGRAAAAAPKGPKPKAMILMAHSSVKTTVNTRSE